MKEKPKGLPKETVRLLSQQFRNALKNGEVSSLHKVIVSVLENFFPQSVVAFPNSTITELQSSSDTQTSALTPNQEKTEKMYSAVATNIWRIKNQILDVENEGEPKESLDSRAITKIARYIHSLETALANVGIEIVSDYENKPHREGSAVNVISYEDRQDLKEDTYIEVLMPTVRLIGLEGQTKLLQAAEVVVGRPKVN